MNMRPEIQDFHHLCLAFCEDNMARDSCCLNEHSHFLKNFPKILQILRTKKKIKPNNNCSFQTFVRYRSFLETTPGCSICKADKKEAVLFGE